MENFEQKDRYMSYICVYAGLAQGLVLNANTCVTLCTRCCDIGPIAIAEIELSR